MSIKVNLDKIRDNIKNADDDDLLDRITFYRAGLEPEAQLMIEVELTKRGFKDEDIEAWAPKPEDPYVWLPDGSVAPCSFCRRPALRDAWAWYRLLGKIPIFPKLYRYCGDHGGEPAGAVRESTE